MTKRLVYDSKDTSYIIYLVRAWEDITLLPSYEPIQPSPSPTKVKQEVVVKKEGKRLATKKMKKELNSKVSLSSYDLLNYLNFI